MSGQASRIRWNSFYFFLSHLIRLFTNFLLFVGIARFYGPEPFGQFTVAHSLAIVFIFLADFGFDALLATEIAASRDQAGEIAQRYLGIKILFVFFASLLMAVLPVVHSFGSTTTSLIWILSLYVLFSSLNNFCFSFLKGLEELHHETSISLKINSLLLVFLAICGWFHLSLPIVGAAFVLTRVMGLLLALNIVGKRITLSFQKLEMGAMRGVIGKVVIFGLLSLFGSLCMQQDTILLSILKTDREVGIYQAAIKLIALILIVPDIATASLMPVLSRLFADRDMRWVRVSRLLNRTFVFIGIIFGSVLLINSDHIISFVYGTEEYSSAVPVLQIFAATVFIRYCVEAHGLILTISNNQKTRMLVVALAVVLNLFANLYVISRFGILGAAVVSLFTNLIIGVGYIVSARKFTLEWRMAFTNMVPPLILTIIMTVVLVQLRTFPIMFTIPPVVILYGIAFYFLGYSKDERELVFALPRSSQAKPIV